ncbi:methyltransferase domain-containing protein [Streptomyces sp. NRRL S-495]|uniref:methyltransferase domain-containing protein n=1 Tax=Streptomyces sp. NRRL S-495 TaxID=1609133 RepID=UPI00069862F1|nr:methyltransferase domain-containing protein [Streptomyces sp. NRRL S-495]
MTTEIEARVRLAREIERGASVLSSRVVEAFLNVPRHPFVPAFYRRDGTKYVPTRGHNDEWLRAVYADDVLVTEVHGVHVEDAPDGGVTGDATSSSTAPGLMAEMLDALDVRPGDRVWEIGTGTGYNAALLCHLAGAGGVTTVDRTGRLVDAARERLRGVGFEPAVLRADGAGTPPLGGPFDRIIATCTGPPRSCPCGRTGARRAPASRRRSRADAGRASSAPASWTTMPSPSGPASACPGPSSGTAARCTTRRTARPPASRTTRAVRRP